MKTHSNEKFKWWYDRSLMLWICIMHDGLEVQVGRCGYGTTADDALEDCIYVNQYCN